MCLLRENRLWYAAYSLVALVDGAFRLLVALQAHAEDLDSVSYTVVTRALSVHLGVSHSTQAEFLSSRFRILIFAARIGRYREHRRVTTAAGLLVLFDDDNLADVLGLVVLLELDLAVLAICVIRVFEDLLVVVDIRRLLIAASFAATCSFWDHLHISHPYFALSLTVSRRPL